MSTLPIKWYPGAARGIPPWLFMLLPMGIFPLGMALGAPIAESRWTGWIVAALMFAGLFFGMSRYVPRAGKLTLEDGRLSIERGSKHDSAELLAGSVALGKWTQQYVGVMGSVIHAGELRIGLRNLVLEDVDYARPALDKVEVWVDASDSRALVEQLRGLGVLGDSGDSAAADYRQSAPAASTAWSVELVPAPSAGYKTMAILFATMTAMGGVIALLDAFTGIVPIVGVMIVLSVGLFFTVKSARERATTLRLGFEDDRIALEDARRGTRLASCAVKELVATPGHTIVQGRGTYTYMTLELTIGAHEPLRIGPADPTHSWKMETPKTRGAAYYVGPPEWKKLLDAIGLAKRAVFGI